MNRRKRGRRQGLKREKMERETEVGERNRDWRERERTIERETGAGERQRQREVERQVTGEKRRADRGEGEKISNTKRFIEFYLVVLHSD